ncbi:NAD(P)-dependent oxidoreductase, partial [bacterium]
KDDCTEAAESVAPYSKRAERVGGPGAGQSMKMANQIAVGGALLGLCESLALAARSGLDVRQARDMIGSGAGGSWSFDNYGPRMLEENWEPGFSIKNQRKDFGYVIDAARALGMDVPGTEVCDAWLAKLDADGKGEDATYRLYEFLRDGEAA